MDFDEIYQTYFRDVYLYILRLSGDGHIAEDVTAETFFKALQNIDRFRGDCEMRVWLCQIAKNCYFSQRRKASRQRALQEVADPGSLMDEQLADREQAGHIREKLHSLPETYKEVFMWRVFAELSFKQIGQIFGKSDNWACVTYHRARALLKSRLEEDEK